MSRGALLFAVLLLGCSAANPTLGPPPSPPGLAEPPLAIPPDLDLVLRIDLERGKSALGDDLTTAIQRLLRESPENAADAATNRLLLALVAHTETAWVGVRPGLSAELTDNVLVLRGDFSDVFPRASLGGEPTWGRARDLGGGVLRMERAAPQLRAAPAVLYYAAPDRVVIGSYAEIDALERTIEQGQGSALMPPETGIVSVRARLDGLLFALRKRAKTVANLLEGAEQLSASASWTGTAFDLRGELSFDSEERARDVASICGALTRALASSERPWLGAALINPVGRFLSVRLELPPGALARELERAP